MKRREFLKSMVALIGLFAAGCGSTKEATEQKVGRDYYHILLISDLHLPVRKIKYFPDKSDQDDICQKKRKLIETVNAWGDVDEAAILGDLPARFGNEEEFASADEFLGGLNFPNYCIAGNHDYAYKEDINDPSNPKLIHGTLEEKKAKLAAFVKRYKMPNLYYARTVGNCRLIYLAPDGCGSDVELSSEQLEWMKKEIADWKNGGPILFFCHAPLKGTLRPYNSSIDTVDFTAQPSEEVAEILKTVPPASLWISGHTHTPPTNDSYADESVNRVHENLVDIHNPTIDDLHLYTNSLYIYKDHITVRTFDHNEGAWMVKLDRTFSW